MTGDTEMRNHVSFPSSLTVTTKPSELPPPLLPTSSSSSVAAPQIPAMSPMLQQMLSENPMMMSAAMQQMMTPPSSSSSSLPGLPSSADLLQQAHALQILAQLQSVLMMNNPMLSQLQQSQVTSQSCQHTLKYLIVCCACAGEV